MNKKLVILLAVAVVVVGGGYLLLSPKSPSDPAPVGGTPATSPTPSPTASKPVPGSPVTSGGTVTVDIKGFAYVSPTTRIGPGTKITWKNYDDVAHNVIGAGFQSKLLKKGESFSYTFNVPGVYPYYCSVHPNMRGEIVVR